MKRLLVLISGGGSNLQALIEACKAKSLDAELVAVISNRPDAYGLQRAKQAGIAHFALDHQLFKQRQDFDQALAELIESQQPDFILLAGFMRILTPDFVAKFQGMLVNIHPSLLPKYPGLQTHQRALQAGDEFAGASVHFVTKDLDGGPVIAQSRVAISETDNPSRLAKKVLALEHQLYPEVVRWLVEGRVHLVNQRVWMDGQALPAQGQLIAAQ